MYNPRGSRVGEPGTIEEAGMGLDRETLLGVAHAERQRVGRMIQYAPPESWETPSAAPGWWNRDVMAHLGAGDTLAAQLVAGEPATELEEFLGSVGGQDPTIDAFNAWTVARRSGLDTREVLTLWGKAAESFLEFAALLSGEDWATRRFEYLAGPIAARYLVQTRVVEWWVHGEDMRATNGLGPQYQHWPVYLTIDLAIRMLPWTLAQAGLDLSGRSLQVRVEGAGEGEWHWGLGSGEVPGPHANADTLITGRAPQLALVAGGRLDAMEAFASGNVVLGGDRALGLTVLKHLRAYPDRVSISRLSPKN
jgi:uncharacterized protein (TIGR03083 family)